MMCIPAERLTFPLVEHTSKITCPRVSFGNMIDIHNTPMDISITYINEIMAASFIKSIALSFYNGLSPSL